jgi:hypothetical protein
VKNTVQLMPIDDAGDDGQDDGKDDEATAEAAAARLRRLGEERDTLLVEVAALEGASAAAAQQEAAVVAKAAADAAEHAAPTRPGEQLVVESLVDREED